MKTLRRFLTIPVLVLMLSSCQPTKPPEFRSLNHFGLKSMSLSEAKIGFSITMYNPNNFGLTVREAVADLMVDSLPMGQFIQESDVVVSKNSEFSVAFTGAVPLGQVLKFKVRDLGNRDVLVQAKGSARLKKAGVTVTKPFDYTGRHRLDELQIFK